MSVGSYSTSSYGTHAHAIHAMGDQCWSDKGLQRDPAVLEVRSTKNKCYYLKVEVMKFMIHYITLQCWISCKQWWLL